MATPSLSLFFPTYNEAENIDTLIAESDAVVAAITPDYEIIIVNDGSTDLTGNKAEHLAKQYPHVRVVHHDRNKGYGAAVWSGIQAATKDYVFFTDADLQFDLKEIRKLLKYVPEYQVVIGYRAKRQDPFIRLLNARGWNWLNRVVFGLNVRDVDCAFKLFERNTVQQLPLKSRGAMLSAELLIRLQRQGIVFKEVAVTHKPRTRGQATGAKPSVILRAFRELVQVYRGDLGNVTHRQAIKFAFVGAINTVVDIGLYYIFTRFIPFVGAHYVTAKILSYGTGSFTGFLMNRAWTFRRSGRIQASELLRYYTTVAFALAVNAGTMYVLVHAVGLGDILAATLATLFSFSVNFTASKLWVFTHTDTKELA